MSKLGYLLISTAFLLSGCASSVKQMDFVGGNKVNISSFNSEKGFAKVNLNLNQDAKNKLSDNLKFNPEQLKATLARALEAKSMIRPDGEYTIDVIITDLRVRSNFTAVAFGFLAGADSVTGTVNILDKNTAPVKSFEVDANYALGGLAGGSDEARMGWIYEKFSEQTLKELGRVLILPFDF